MAIKGEDQEKKKQVDKASAPQDSRLRLIAGGGADTKKPQTI